MARTPRWKEEKAVHGIKVVKLSSWKYFHDYIQHSVLNYKNYIFRGQSNAAWQLEPSIIRHLKNVNVFEQSQYEKVKTNHLSNFKFSIRGRSSYLQQIVDHENELWALGQHHGLY